MALCRDPALTFLNDQGYNVVRLPRAGIDPLDVLGRDGGRLERLGSLPQVWSTSEQVPGPPAIGPAASISGQSTGNLKLSLGLKLLGDILGALGASTPHLDFAYRSARSIQLSFVDVETAAVDPFAIGRFLSSGDLASGNPFVARFFEDEDAEVFVIFEVLRTGSLAVAAQGSNGAEVAVDLPAIQGAVGAKVSVAQSSGREALLTFTGEEPLSFGFKAFELSYVDGDWRVQGADPSPDMAFGDPTAAASAVRPARLSRSGRVVLR